LVICTTAGRTFCDTSRTAVEKSPSTFDADVTLLLVAVLPALASVAVAVALVLVTAWVEIAAVLDVTPLELLFVVAVVWLVELLALSELAETPHPARSAIIEVAARS
jgi:hypothetical protein